MDVPELPLVGDRRERGDAAANRERILHAARRLLAERGVTGMSMDAVAAAAGVGKGTVFRRFGDRTGLIRALLDDVMRDFQDAFLAGPPPLGPGAAPTERLEAFVLELARLQDAHLELALASSGPEDPNGRQIYWTLRAHIRALLSEIDPELDADVVAGLLLGATAPPVLHGLGVGLEALQASLLALLRGLTRPR